MTDKDERQEQPQGFKVSDRRKRYDETSEPAAGGPADEAPQSAAKPAPEPAPEHAGAEPSQDEAGVRPDGVPAPADFLQLVGKLYQEGLAFMGLFDDPKTGQSMANFPVASWHIDILGLLEEKTKGNLSAEEAQMLKEAIANMKVTFVRASGFIKH